MTAWLFQCNPDNYRILDAIHDLTEVQWIVSRYDKEIKSSDNAVIWIASGKALAKAGIYALGLIIKPPAQLSAQPDLEYWRIKKPITHMQVVIRFTQKLLASPILKTTIADNPILSSMSILQFRNATNFKVTESEWLEIKRLSKAPTHGLKGY
jgi:hypothetical protein